MAIIFAGFDFFGGFAGGDDIAHFAHLADWLWDLFW